MALYANDTLHMFVCPGPVTTFSLALFQLAFLLGACVHCVLELYRHRYAEANDAKSFSRSIAGLGAIKPAVKLNCSGQIFIPMLSAPCLHVPIMVLFGRNCT
jgi:hypothetical protein